MALLVKRTGADEYGTKALDRFWSKVQITCWLWLAADNGDGYGVFWVDGRLVPAHVFAWEQENGPVPDGLVLDHVVCDNPPCVRPDHLNPTTMLANLHRSPRWFGNRTECPQGHPYDEANTYRRPGGGRDCKRCNADRAQRFRDRQLMKEGSR